MQCPDAELKEWERQSGEPDRWWGRFLLFRDAGPRRSLRGTWRRELETAEAERKAALERAGGTEPTAEAAGKSREKRYLPGSWQQAHDRWRWRERAAAWDIHEADERQAARAEQYERHREREWAASQRLLDMAETMMRFPLTRTEQSRVDEEDGKKTVLTTIIMPAGWNIGDLRGCLDLASKLGRLSVDRETERQAVDQQTIIYHLPDNGRGD